MKNDWETGKIRLRPIEAEDWEIIFSIMSDTETVRLFDTVAFPSSISSAKNWAEERSKNNNEERYTWIIETLSGDKVGALNVFDVNRAKGSFFYGVVMLPDHRRKGFASDAVTLMLRFYFQELRYNKCNATVYDFNHNSVQFHEKFGFQLEGRLREMGYTQGRYFDHLIYGMTGRDFAQRNT